MCGFSAPVLPPPGREPPSPASSRRPCGSLLSPSCCPAFRGSLLHTAVGAMVYERFRQIAPLQKLPAIPIPLGVNVSALEWPKGDVIWRAVTSATSPLVS